MATSSSHAASKRKWSQDVTAHSDALDLKDGVFKQRSAKKIAESLKASAEHSDRRKSSPYRSAMSMLTFYINRAGDNLGEAERKRLDGAKDELRKLFDRPPAKPAAARKKGDTKAAAASRPNGSRKTH